METGIAEVFARVMMVAAVTYCEQRKLPINAEHLSSCLRAHKERISGAMKDAAEAIEANMPQVAEATFRASAAAAGIDAAKMYELESGYVGSAS